jgi:hypothetical protein
LYDKVLVLLSGLWQLGKRPLMKKVQFAVGGGGFTLFKQEVMMKEHKIKRHQRLIR